MTAAVSLFASFLFLVPSLCAQGSPSAPTLTAAQRTGFGSATITEANILQLQPWVMASLASDSEVSAAGNSSPAAPSLTPVIRADGTKPKFHWRPALWESARFLLVMHAFRLATEPSTRAELKGRFWGDYFDSVLGYGGWGDGDPFMVNYIGHPLEGSVAGYIYLQNDDRSRDLAFGKSGAYWKSRLKATAWGAAFSLQFEFGPLSEGSIGNVGREPRRDGGSYMGNVDLFITPIMGFGWMVAEDALDRYAIIGIERRTRNRVVRALARGFLSPSRSFANMMRGKPPWFRDDRPLRRPAELGERRRSQLPPVRNQADTNEK